MYEIWKFFPSNIGVMIMAVTSLSIAMRLARIHDAEIETPNGVRIKP